MAFEIGGFSQGLSSGLLSGMRFGRAYKEGKREDTEFDWKKKDRDRQETYQAEVENLTKNSPLAGWVEQQKPVAPVTPAANGLTPAPAPADGTAPASAAAPTTPAATGLTPPAPARPAAPQLPGFNDMNDYLIKRAAIDVKYGKLDGAGIMSLYKGIQAMKTEGAVEAIKLLHAGRADEAMQAFNSSGTTKAQIVSMQDGEYDLGGNKMPTRIVTLLNPDTGQTQTINTAQALIQFKDIADIAKLVAEGGKMAETKRHNRVTEAADTTRANAAMKAAEARETKAGTAKPVRYPQRGAVLDAQDLIKGDPELSKLSDDDQRRLAFNTAAKTQALIQAQPGIDAAEALNQALGEETANITPGETRSFLGVDMLAPDKKPTYIDRRTAAARMPAAAPATAAAQPKQPAAPQPVRITGDADYAQLPSGALYIDPDGVTRRKR